MDILLFGTGGHAKVIASIIELENIHNIKGIINQDGLTQNTVPGYPVLGSNQEAEEILEDLNIKGAIVGLGDIRDRKNVARMLEGLVEFVKSVHPAAIIDSSISLGPGTVVMPGAVINSSTCIGSHCIINTKSSIDHDCNIGNFTNIGPGVSVAGNVKIGRECNLGIGTSVVNQIEIGEGTTIGAGSVVVKDIPANVTAFGVPAIVRR
jgi:sugar O-acyltransferase (sialic acid O-acetyltransferase NeuD family)